MNYGFELMSEIIPLCIVAVLGIDMKKGGEKDFLPSIIILSIIEIPTLIVTLFLYVHKKFHNQIADI